MPRDIQLLFAVLPLSKGRNVEVVDNVCANSCELTAYIALCVSLSLFFSLSSSFSSSLLPYIRCFARYDLFSPSHLTSFRLYFFQSFFCSPSRFCSRSDIFSPLSRQTDRTLFPNVTRNIYIYMYIYTRVCIHACASDQNGSRYD